jgi:hypothetical protein
MFGANSCSRMANVENVFLDQPAPGVWKVIVAAHRIAGDQHRGTTAWDQHRGSASRNHGVGSEFALVVNGVQRDRVPMKPLSK